jgi:hypothetical protein
MRIVDGPAEVIDVVGEWLRRLQPFTLLFGKRHAEHHAIVD